VHPVEFAFYAVLGVAGGFLSVAFTKLLLGMRQRFLLLPRKSRWWHPVVGGIVVGVMGFFVPQVLGVGYSYVGDALNGGMALRLMLVLVVLKLFAITTSYASGNAGGIFGPSLFLGAMLGGAVGNLAHHFFPAHTATPGAYALVGMGALFAGIVRAPMTSVLMIFEMTRDYSVIVPLMIANLASLFISSRLQKQPIYEALAHQDGIHLPLSGRREGLGQHRVFEIMRQAAETFSSVMPASEALQRAQQAQIRGLLVTDEGSLIGVLSRSNLETAIGQDGTEKKLGDFISTLEFPHVHRDHALHIALERMSQARIDVLPVVSRADIHKLEGVVTLRDLLDSYGVDPTGSA
jgi:chloride channel protein, CIC family